MDELERQTQLLLQSMDEFTRSGSLAGNSLEKVEKSTSTFNKTITKAEQALEKFGKTASGKTLKVAGDIAAGFGRSAQAARDNRESFESLNPIINSAATALSAIPIVGDALGKTLSTVGTFVTAELQKSVEAFQTLGSVGAVGASGVSGLRKSAEEAGLSFAQLSKITQSNASNLAFVFGSTATGLEQIANLTKAAEPFRQELLGLGIGLTQQTEYFADYLQVQQRLGRQQIKDTRVLAANSAAYAKNLTDLSRITGMSTDAAQAELDSQLSNIRFRRALADVDKKTGDAIQNVGLVIAGIGKDPNLTRGFQDLVAGFGTQAGTDFEIATGGIGNQIAQNLRAGAITEQQAIQQIQDALKATYEKLPAQIFGRGTPFDNVSLGMANLATAQIDYAKALQQGRDAAKTPDTATKAMTDAQMSLQRFATEADTFVNNQVFPRATEVIGTLTDSLSKLTGGINQLAGTKTRAKGGPVSAGEPYLVGEAGPELMIPQVAGEVFTNKNTNAILQQYQSNMDVIQNGMQMFQTAFANQNVLNQRPGPIETSRGASFDALGEYNIEGYRLRGVAGTTILDTAGNIVKHIMPVFVEKLTSTLFANNNRSISYRGGSFSFEAILNQQNELLRTINKYTIGGDTHTQIKDFVNRLKTTSTKGYSAQPAYDPLIHDKNFTKSFANGGIASGPKSGYTAMLHGTEAVVPLPDGKNIPVQNTDSSMKTDAQIKLMEQQIGRLDNLISLMQSQNTTSKKLLRAQS
jgi:hypothetical protein